MLVIISDLHLTDGTLGQTLPADAFRTFAQQMHEQIGAASNHFDEKQRPAEGVDLLLLGDAFDLLRSGHWFESDVRPWSNLRSPQLAATLSQIVAGILRVNAEAIAVLRSLADSLPTRIHYMLGDRDWMLRLPGAAYDRVRQLIVEQLGLANRGDLPFPHDPAECGVILETLRRHRVVARHGDIFDPISFSGDRNASGLSDAIAIELVNRFAVQQNVDIDNVHPLLNVADRLECVLERPDAKDVWIGLVERLLELDFVREQESVYPIDLIDSLRQVLLPDLRLSSRRAEAIVNLLHGFGEGEATYRQHALAEQDVRQHLADYAVYGHVQTAESGSMYFNAGRWPTCLTFYQASERRKVA